MKILNNYSKMIINANTKIAAILKQHPDALEAIISISSKFEKLRIPLLRKLMAGRTSISMASKIGGCSINDFFIKLKPLGFEIDNITQPVTEDKNKLPDFITSIKREQVVELDVRPILSSGTDPLNTILEKLKAIETGHILKIINTFEPIPLIKLLEKKGFITYTDNIQDDLVETYFYKKSEPISNEIPSPVDASKGWADVLSRFKDKVQMIDVRALEMPQPMLTILDALDKLPSDTALYVHHKRIPVFLLPELAERKFDYRIKEISDSEVHLLIYKI
ncbi:MAG TPA: DUF2249 domain-containing protein [Bacteroidia bacterium]|nr:DUF2249 domain-containing protein [Bacteroidia bacterium]